MSKRTIPCNCPPDLREECFHCKGTGTYEFGENEFEWLGDFPGRAQGAIIVGVDGSLMVTPDDTHYRGTITAAEAYALAIRILELQNVPALEGVNLRKLIGGRRK